MKRVLGTTHLASFPAEYGKVEIALWYGNLIACFENAKPIVINTCTGEYKELEPSYANRPSGSL